MWLGVDYYPEQWNPELMDADMDTIKAMLFALRSFPGI